MSAPVQPAVHTPGPWEVKGPSQNGHCRRIFAGDGYVGIVGGSDQPMRTIRANADLVAAAPEMLEALRSCRMHIEALERIHDHELPEGEMLRAAIAKATGEIV